MPEPKPDLLHWNSNPGDFRGEIGVAIRPGGEHWRRVGATFSESDDVQGERPLLATGTVDTDRGPVEFGVLDYGDEGTFLLVAAEGEKKEEMTTLVVRALEAAGLIAETDLYDEKAPYVDDSSEASGRMTILEGAMGEYLANAQPSVIPIAKDISFYGHERITEKAGLESMRRHSGTLKEIVGDEFGVIEPDDGSREILLVLWDDISVPPGHIDVGSKLTYRYSLLSISEFHFQSERDSLMQFLRHYELASAKATWGKKPDIHESFGGGARTGRIARKLFGIQIGRRKVPRD